MSTFANQKAHTVGFVSLGVVVGAVLATFVCMALLSPNSQSANPIAESPSSSSDEGASQKGKKSSKTLASMSRIAELDDLSNIDSAFERTFNLHGLLMHADEGHLKNYLQRSSDIKNPTLRNQILAAVVQRLAESNPKDTLKAISELPDVQGQPLLATVFGEWSNQDLDGALAHAKSLTESERLAALDGILTSRSDLSDSLQQQIARQLGHEQFAMQSQSSETVSSSGGDPRQAWNALVNDAYEDIAQIGTLVQIAQTLVQQNGFEALDWIRDSLIDDTVLEATVRSVLHHVALSDPQSAFLQAQSISRDAQDVALPTIVEMWARSDPMVAMGRLSSLKNASQRKKLQTTLLRAWAENDAQDLFDNLEQIPESIRQNAEQQAMLAVARSSPNDAVVYLAELTARDRQQALAMEIAEHWSQQDIYAALEWVLNHQFTTESARRRPLSEVLRNLVDVDPTLALQTALKQPILTKYGRGLEAMVIEQLARTDLESAISMLSQIREGSTTVHAYISAGRALVQNGDYDRALRLGQQLPDDQQSAYRHSVMWQWAEADPQSLLASLDDLPSQDAKTQAALGLVMANFRTKALSDEQLKYVSSVLPQGQQGTYTFSSTTSSPGVHMVSDQLNAEVMQVIEQAMAERAATIGVDGGTTSNAVFFVDSTVEEVKIERSEEED